MYRVDLDRCPEDMLVYARLPEGGDVAVGIFNMSEGDYRFVFGLTKWELPLIAARDFRKRIMERQEEAIALHHLT